MDYLFFSYNRAKKDLLELTLDISIKLPSLSLNDIDSIYAFLPVEADHLATVILKQGHLVNSLHYSSGQGPDENPAWCRTL